MQDNLRRQSPALGIVVTLFGGVLLSPLLYRRESVDWHSLWTYLIILLGLFLATLGIVVTTRAMRSQNLSSALGVQFSAQKVDPAKPKVPIGLAEPKPMKEVAEVADVESSAGYYRFAKVIGLSPSLPLLLTIVLNISCSSFGSGLGFACSSTSSEHVTWLETFAYLGVLGWVLSLPAWAILVFAGKLLGIR